MIKLKAWLVTGYKKLEHCFLLKIKRDYADGSAFWLQIINMKFNSSISLKNK